MSVVIYGKDFGTLVNTGTCIIKVHEHRTRCDEYEYFIIAEMSGKQYNLMRCKDYKAAKYIMDSIAIEEMRGTHTVTLWDGDLIASIRNDIQEKGTAAESLDKIADALEDIAIEAQRPHEEAMEQRRRRGAAAERTANSSERGHGE